MNESIQLSFGEWLKLKRKRLDLTREEFAKQVGYSAATLRKIEDEERRPSEEFVEKLVEIFNISESERESFLQFARGDGKFASNEIHESQPWRASNKSPRLNIPATTTSLIAREKEISLIREYLSKDDIRLITLIGPPGIGKTRLSIEAARTVLHDFPDGVFFVPLATVDDSKSIASTIIQVLGYLEGGSLPADGQLIKGIGDKQMLIVLDNCEHLIEAITIIASDLLSACSGLKILTTSRESFRIPGEWLYPVPAFDIPEENETINLDNASDFPALMLFAERAHAVKTDFKLTDENIRTVVAICAHLDGLPLVIELMASRMRLMSPQALLERLSSQFVLTADGMRAPSERQKTLRNAIDWSYHLLSAEEQKLFMYLSVFSSGFSLAEAETIFAQDFIEKSVPELLTLLLDKSLIRRVIKESNEDHYEMLVTIHEYALERLRESGKETEIRNRHLAYFLNLVEKAEKELFRQNQLEWLTLLRLTRDNLRAALDWAVETKQTESALLMASKLDWFWHICSDYVEGAQWVLCVLELQDVSLFPEAHAQLLTQLQHFKHLLGQHASAKIQKGEAVSSYVEQALAIARANNDSHNIARALAMIGLGYVTKKDFAKAQSILEESGKLFQQSQDEWGYGFTVFLLGWKSFVQNDFVPALPILEQASGIFKNLGERLFICVSKRYLGVTQIKLGATKEGIEAVKESLRLARQIDSKYETAAGFYRLGQAAQYLGSPKRTVSLFWAAKTAYESINSGMWTQGMDAEFETVLQRCRDPLGEATYNQAMEQGRNMTMEEAIEYALDEQIN